MTIAHGLRARSKDLVSRHLRKGSSHTFLGDYRIGNHVEGAVSNGVHTSSFMPPKSYHNRCGTIWNFTHIVTRLQTHKQVDVAAGSRQFSASSEIPSAGKSETSGTKRSDLFIKGGLVAILLTALGLLEYKEGFLFRRDNVKKPAEIISQYEEKGTVKDENSILNQQFENQAQFAAFKENQEQSSVINNYQKKSVFSNDNQEKPAASNEALKEPENFKSNELSKINDHNQLNAEHKDPDILQFSKEKQQLIEDKIVSDEGSNFVTVSEGADAPSLSNSVTGSEDTDAPSLDSSKQAAKSLSGATAAHAKEKDIQDAVTNTELHEAQSEDGNLTSCEPAISNASKEVTEPTINTSDAEHLKKGSLLETYLLQKGHEDNVKLHVENQKDEIMDALSSQSIKNKLHDQITEVGDAGSNLDDDKRAIEVVAAIHAAEQRQAQIDAAAFVGQLQDVEDKYQRELKDIQAKLLMYAEHVKRLKQDLEVEKVKHSSELRMQQDLSDKNLQHELKVQEEASKLKQEETQLLAKMEALATFVEERVALLKELGDVKLQVDALHAAFNSRSEEARLSSTMHKLALGAFSLEDAMLRGAPVQKEVALILDSTGGPGTDPLVDVAVMSLPERAIKVGTRTPVELHQKFLNIKQQLRELALIPADGGGVLTHALAWLVSFLKVSEDGSRDANNGIEAALGQVALFLTKGKLIEAADALEEGSAGTKAQKLASEWATEVRHRVIMEQACSLLRAHSIATSLSFF